MKQGLYEAVINNKLLDELSTLNEDEFIIDKENINNEEAKVILASYIESVIRRSLDYIRDKKKITI